MNKLIYLILIVAFFSCKDRKSVIERVEMEELTQVQIDSVLTKFKFEYGTPITLESGSQMLIPISTKRLKRNRIYSKDGYSADYFPRYWNVLFYDLSTGKTNLLTKEKISISEIYAKKYNHNNYQEHETTLKDKILYKISDIDFNKDGKLNSLDPEFLFISEIDGSKLLRISPLNEDLVYYEVIKATNEIILSTRRDLNNDSLFNNEDKLIWYKSTMGNGKWENTEIIDSLNREKIEKLYFEQWLQKK